MKKGFTLAEILISLLVIGVIASVTLPVLQNTVRKKELTAKYEKAYSTLSQGLLKAEAHGGFLTDWNMDSGEQVYKDYFSKVFSVTKTCLPGDNSCEPDVQYRYLSGSRVSNPFPNSLFRFITSDGAVWAIGINRSCIQNDLYCALIRVDVNGEAAPNAYGRDVFTFFMLPYTNEIKPEGLYDYPASYTSDGWPQKSATAIDDDCSKNGGGMLCGAKIIKDGFQMKY